MRYFLLPLFLLFMGCKKPHGNIVQPTVTAQEQANRLLQRQVWKDRVLLKRTASIRLEHTGETYVPKSSENFDIPLEKIAKVDQFGTQVMFDLGCKSLAFFAYVHTDDLTQTTTKRSSLQPQKGRVFQHSSVEISTGLPLKVLQCQDDRCQIQVDSSAYQSLDPEGETNTPPIKVWGWLEKSALGYVYQPQDFSLETSDTCYAVKQETKIYDGEQSQVFAAFGLSVDGSPYRDLHWQPDTSSLSFQQKRLGIRGNVSSDNIHEVQCSPRMGSGSGCGWGVSHGRFTHLQRGVPVYAQPAGKVVGVVTKGAKFIVRQTKGRWKQIYAPSQWEGLALWIKDVD